MSNTLSMVLGFSSGTRTTGVMSHRSATRIISPTVCRSNTECSMSMKAPSNPALAMISTTAGSANPTWLTRARPPSRMICFILLGFMKISLFTALPPDV